MLFSQDRDELRRMYAEAWRKARQGLPLSPLEAQIADIVAAHPEYQQALGEEGRRRDYTPAEGGTNPFLHMGLHMAIREQVATDRPAGIREIHRTLSARLGDVHAAEHRMLECLAEALWQSQQDRKAPDEGTYLLRLRRLVHDAV